MLGKRMKIRENHFLINVLKVIINLIKKYFFIILLNFLIFLFLFECTSRFYLSFRKSIPFTEPQKVCLFYYPEITETYINYSKKDWNILLLGASVLNPAWGSVEKELSILLEKELTRPFQIHNFGMPSHTTRDSLIKYSINKDKYFDKIFVYHGINEVRMNNYPNKFYRTDYSHVIWYRSVNIFRDYSKINFLGSPYVFNQLCNKTIFNQDESDFENLNFGNEIKTENAIENNLNDLVKLVGTKRDNLIFSTFASFVPENYTKEKFHNKNLDYGKHSLPIEVWGLKNNVVKTINVHNKAIKKISDFSNIHCIEMDRAIPKNGTYFDDICHLTTEGSKTFAEKLLPYLLP